MFDPTSGSRLVGWMVWPPSPGIANLISCEPAPALFASMIAWRRDPAPLSAVVVTVKLAAWAAAGPSARAAAAQASRRKKVLMPLRLGAGRCGDVAAMLPHARPPARVVGPRRPRRWRSRVLHR